MPTDNRDAFESWISSPPYELSTKRLPDASAWPGQYADIGVQRAWDAWQESSRLCSRKARRLIERLQELLEGFDDAN